MVATCSKKYTGKSIEMHFKPPIVFASFQFFGKLNKDIGVEICDTECVQFRYYSS